MDFNKRILILEMHGTNIKKINTLHLYQHYSLFMHNKLEYT